MTAPLPTSINNIVIQNQDAQALLQNPLLNKNIWHPIEDLKLTVKEHRSPHIFNFEPITQDWLKLLAKTHILLRSNAGTSTSTLYSEIHYLRKFSGFLSKYSIERPDQINNQVFEELDCYLRSQELSESSIGRCYTVLSNFFDTCRVEKWLEINTYWFRGRRRAVSEPLEIDYLPEEVWNQLNENLYHLPGPLQRMVLVIRTLGLRIGELCTMPFDCLRKRNGQWRIRFETEKYQAIDELPILSLELVAVIKEQQQYICQHFGNEYDKLFCSNSTTGRGRDKANGIKDAMIFTPKPTVMRDSSFNNWLNRLARKCEIRANNGEIWKFRSHQFRRTVGTIMTNAGVRDLIIQKYLRHRSPNMQKYYKHLLKQVLGDEYETLMEEKKYVDIAGTVIASHKPANPITEILRRRLYQITTQYGECHRPILKDPCPTVNACWHCLSWRVSNADLSFLKEDLKRVEEEVEVAIRLGMVRQQQGLEDDRNVLLKVIQRLEQADD
jgi:integrase